MGGVVLDFSKAVPITDPASDSLKQSVGYGAQQNPDEYAKLLELQRKTGVAPEIGQHLHDELKQAADVNSINYNQFTQAAPRTSAWATRPENSAISGVDELHRLSGIEGNRSVMASVSAYSPSWGERAGDRIADVYSFLTGTDRTGRQFKQQAYEFPLSRAGIDVVGGTAGLAGNVGSFLGIHGSGSTKQNLLQRFETTLNPETNVDPERLYSKSNEFDWLSKNVAPMVPAVLATGGTGLLARTLGLSSTASKVLAGLGVGGLFTADQAGRTYTQVADAGGSDYDARLAANRVAAITAIPNALFAGTDLVPFTRNNPLLTSLGLGAIQGGTGQLATNVVTGKPLTTDLLSTTLQSMAMQGGMHLGTEAFFGNVGDAIQSSEESKLRERSPEKFHDALQQVFQGDESLRIPADAFREYFAGKGMKPGDVAQTIGAINYAEASLSGGDVEVPKAGFFAKMDPEDQKGLFPNIVDPVSGLTLNQHQEGREELQKWVAEGGADKLIQETSQTDQETRSTPEFQQVKEDLRQRYVDAGETPEVAETLAEKDANVYSNLARNAGMKPSEVLAMYNPKVVSEDTREGFTLNQDIEPSGDAPKGWGVAEPAGTRVEKRGWMRVLDDGTVELGKTKFGDMSTFAHESAHAYLHVLNDLATREGASETLKADHAKILDFLGAKHGEALTREQHEMWARANEQYLREGKAPSSKLRGVFQRFGIWLQSVYKKASDLGVELNDNIRGVLDRLYAAEEGVNRASEEAGPKMFTSAEEAGWTEEQFQNYANAHDVSIEDAKSHILSKLNEARLRDSTDSWCEEEANVRTAVTAEIDQRPDYAAIRQLRKGALDDGTELKMSKESLVKQFGEDRVKALQKAHPGLYRTEGGIDAETAAEMLGFDSAESMVGAIETAPRRSAAIETATQEYMTAKHGDIRYDGSLKDESDLAVANDKRAELLHREMRALNRRNNPEFELREAERELKRYEKELAEDQKANETRSTARDMTSLANVLLKQTDKQREQLEARDQKIEDLKQQIAQMQEAVKEARQSDRAGNRFAQATAPIESYREAAKIAIDAKAPADIQPQRYLDASRKYAMEAFKALAKEDYWGAKQAKHKELMNHFLFREAVKAKEFVGKLETNAKRYQSKAVQAKLGLAGEDHLSQFNQLMSRYGLGPTPAMPPARTLADWSEDQYDQGKEPAIEAPILNEARTVNYRSAPISELRQVQDALKNIKALAYQELGMTVNDKKIVFNSAKENMIAAAVQNNKVTPTRVISRNATTGERAISLVQRGDALLSRTEFLMGKLDGGKAGPWHDFLWNLASDAQGREYALHEQVTKTVGDAIERMPKEMRKGMLDKVTIDGVPETLTRHDLVSMAMNMGNDGNLDRLQKTFESHGWDVGAIEKIKEMISREEWQFVQDAWDSLKPLGEAQSEMERRLTGLPPVMVKPTPLHLTLADGKMDLPGGYYPIVMDSRFSRQGALQDASRTAQNTMESGYGRATTSRGAMKERTGYGGPLQLDYEQVLTQHTAKVIKDISHREFMLTANKFLLDPTIRQTLRETLGEGYEEQMMPWLRTIINDRNGSSVQGLGDASRLIRGLRTNLVKAALTFKASTVLLQLTHASSVFLHTSPKSYSQAMVDFLAHPFEMSKEIRELSPNEMKSRGDNIDRDMRAVLQDKKSLGRTLARAGMAPVQFMDHVLSFPLWLSVYRDAQAAGHGNNEAMHMADGAVRMGLGSNAPKDLPPVMRNNDFWKLVTTLGGFHNLKYNQIRSVGSEFARSRNPLQLTYGLAMASIIPAVLGQLITGHGPRDDENPGLWAAKKALLFPAETIPLLGNIIQGIEQHGDVSFSPLASMAERIAKAGAHAASDSEDKDWTGIGMDTLQTVMDAYGVVGTDQLFKTAKYARKVENDQVADPNIWDAITGAPRK